MSYHPATDPRTTSGRCGDRGPGVAIGDLSMPGDICILPADHDGHHRADSGDQWRKEKA